MASEVEICNLALAHIGDSATVASISPAEPTMQAELCARFYPMARDALLEMPNTDWAFATKRAILPEVASETSTFDFAYSMPNDCLRIISVLPPDAVDDNEIRGLPFPRDFTLESNAAGQSIIYTDLENATVRYVARVIDTTKFSPTFVMALSWKLASMLAGPIIKGDVGAAESARCTQMGELELSKAVRADASNHRVRLNHVSSFIRGR